MTPARLPAKPVQMAQERRGEWGSKFGFILAAAGSAVGLGNVWKFPYITGENGGGLFVIIYLICIGLVGLPIMIGEIMLGRMTQRSPVGAFRQARWRQVAVAERRLGRRDRGLRDPVVLQRRRRVGARVHRARGPRRVRERGPDRDRRALRSGRRRRDRGDPVARRVHVADHRDRDQRGPKRRRAGLAGADAAAALDVHRAADLRDDAAGVSPGRVVRVRLAHRQAHDRERARGARTQLLHAQRRDGRDADLRLVPQEGRRHRDRGDRDRAARHGRRVDGLPGPVPDHLQPTGSSRPRARPWCSRTSRSRSRSCRAARSGP